MFQEGLPLPDQTTGYAWCDLFLLCCSAAPHPMILRLVGRTHPMAYVKSVPFIDGLLIYVYIYICIIIYIYIHKYTIIFIIMYIYIYISIYLHVLNF